MILSQVDLQQETPICQGAEARIYKVNVEDKNYIIKERFSKKYRVEELDTHIRKKNTKAEIQALKKCSKKGVPAPRYIEDDMERSIVVMSYVEGVTVKEYLDKNLDTDSSVGTALGELVGKVHAAGIVHGDLTTSNFVIDKSTSTYTIIDFGLASTTNNDEPRAVDLHVLEKAVSSAHPNRLDIHDAFLEGYKSAMTFNLTAKSAPQRTAQIEKIFKRLEAVRQRGRKRSMVG